jgi:hypothetical protein
LAPTLVKNYVFLVVLLIGISIEIIQTGIHGRISSAGDILRNQLGVLVTFAFFTGKTKKIIFYRIAVSLLVCVAITPLTKAVIDELTALRKFPILANFTTPFEVDRWEPTNLQGMQKSITEDGVTALKLQLTTKKYSGASLFYFPGNWKDYNNLFIRIYSPEKEKLTLFCRIHDQDHNGHYNDRFKRSFILDAGWNNLVIAIDDIQHAPEHRLMNLKKIEELTLFVMQQKQKRVIYVSTIFLAL